MQRRYFLKTMALSAGGLLLPYTWVHAVMSTRIKDVRFWTAPDHSRIVFDLDRETAHTLFSLKNPNRLVVDIKNTVWGLDPSTLTLSDSVVRRVRTGAPVPGVVRTVFELRGEVVPHSFLLNASPGRGPRLVVDLYRNGMEPVASIPTVPKKPVRKRDAVIVIDPGHGGEDPGAVGRGGTKEKHIALAVARRMQRRLNRMAGIKAHLTRSGDYYVSLRRRVSIARQHRADLLVSLHADAFHTSAAKGASVFCLSEHGKPSPDKAIRLLVKRENSADLIGGVELDRFEPEVQGFLMDMSQRDSIEQALRLAQKLIYSLDREARTDLHFKEVKKAGFAVLKAPDMPSVLVEMAFLSNRQEERLLRRKPYQEALARALAAGTRRFVKSSILV